MSESFTTQLEREAVALEERADLLRHVADGGNIEYAYADLVGNHAGPPARWWPLGIDRSLSADSIAEQVNGYLGDEPVIYRKVAAPVVRYSVIDGEGLIGATTGSEELALRWLKESTDPTARIVKLVEAEY